MTAEEEMAALRRHWLIIGQVAQMSATAELHLRQLMVGLLDSQYAQIVAAGLAITELIDTCSALAKANRDMGDEERTEILGLLSELKGLLPLRNHLVHGLWIPYGDVHIGPEVAPMALISKRRTEMKTIPIAYETAQAIADDLNRVGRSIFNWTIKVLLTQINREQVGL